MILPMMFSASRLAPWQAMYTYAGTYQLIVPEGCTSIAAVAIGSGGGGARGASGDTNSSPAGGGGALSYSNAIPVTPGEELTIVVPNGGYPGGNMSSGSAAADAGIKRGSTWLLMAQGGRGGNWASGIGGSGGFASAGVGDVCYSGGKGRNAASFTYGGWSGRYTGNGVDGNYDQNNLSANLFGADAGTGIGRGGAGGKSSANAGAVGGVRIMWGDDRAFPGNCPDIVRPGWWRYFRIYVTAIGSSDVFGLGEIELRGSAGGTDMTNTGTRVNGTNGVGIARIVDGKWAVEADCYEAFAAAAPYFVSADLGTYTAEQAVYAAELAIYPNVTNPAAKSPKDFVVQGSLDDATWTDIKSFAGVVGWTAGTPKIFDLT